MDLDTDKIDDAALALLRLTLHDGYRAWKGFDWDILDRLHAKGMIDDPRNKNKSIAFTDAGLERAERLLEGLFAKAGSARTPKETDIRIFRVTLEPQIYREIEIPAAKSLYDLAKAIVAAFGFDFDHAFGFFSKLSGNIFASPVKYELFADMGEGKSRSVKRTRVADAFPSTGSKMTFLFDYGDGWEFRIELIGEGEKQKGVKYPKVAKAVGEAPGQYPSADDAE